MISRTSYPVAEEVEGSTALLLLDELECSQDDIALWVIPSAREFLHQFSVKRRSRGTEPFNRVGGCLVDG